MGTLTQICREHSNLYSEASKLVATLSEFFCAKGFKSLQYLGRGEEGLVVASADNPNIVFRIAHLEQRRKPIPSMLQPVGVWEVEGALNPLSSHTKIEVLPRLQMNVTVAELEDDEREIRAHECFRAASVR